MKIHPIKSTTLLVAALCANTTSAIAQGGLDYFGYHLSSGHTNIIKDHVNLTNLWLEYYDGEIHLAHATKHRTIQPTPENPYPLEWLGERCRVGDDVYVGGIEDKNASNLSREIQAVRNAGQTKIVLDIERLVFDRDGSEFRGIRLNKQYRTRLAELESIVNDNRDLIFSLYIVDEPYWRAKPLWDRRRATVKNVFADFDGDGQTDISVLTDKQQWEIDYSSNGYGLADLTLDGYGVPGRPLPTPTPADYDGDGKADLSFKQTDGNWFIDYSNNEGSDFKNNKFGHWDVIVSGYGGSDAIPASADYDGNGRADLSVKTADGRWLIDYARNGFGRWDIVLNGYGGDNAVPVPGDYDGDNIADISVKTSNGYWLIDYAGNGFGAYETVLADYGNSTAIPVPADFNGDGCTDLSVKVADGRWLIDYCDTANPTHNGFGAWDKTMYDYGNQTAVAIAADFDGNGSTDLGILDINDNLRIDYGPKAYTSDALTFGVWDTTLLHILNENIYRDIKELVDYLKTNAAFRDIPLQTTFAYPTLVSGSIHYLGIGGRKAEESNVKYFNMFDYLAFDYYGSFEMKKVELGSEKLQVGVKALNGELNNIVYSANRDGKSRRIFLTPPASAGQMTTRPSDNNSIVQQYYDLGVSNSLIIGMLPFQWPIYFWDEAAQEKVEYCELGKLITNKYQDCAEPVSPYCLIDETIP